MLLLIVSETGAKKTDYNKALHELNLIERQADIWSDVVSEFNKRLTANFDPLLLYSNDYFVRFKHEDEMYYVRLPLQLFVVACPGASETLDVNLLKVGDFRSIFIYNIDSFERFENSISGGLDLLVPDFGSGFELVLNKNGNDHLIDDAEYFRVSLSSIGREQAPGIKTVDNLDSNLELEKDSVYVRATDFTRQRIVTIKPRQVTRIHIDEDSIRKLIFDITSEVAWRNKRLGDVYADLFGMGPQWKSAKFDDLREYILMQIEKMKEGDIELVGIRAPVMVARVFGVLLIALLQLIFYFHLRFAYEEAGYGGHPVVAFHGLYGFSGARYFFKATAVIVPILSVIYLTPVSVRASQSYILIGSMNVFLIYMSGYIGLLTAKTHSNLLQRLYSGRYVERTN